MLLGLGEAVETEAREGGRGSRVVFKNEQESVISEDVFGEADVGEFAAARALGIVHGGEAHEVEEGRPGLLTVEPSVGPTVEINNVGDRPNHRCFHSLSIV